MDVEMRGNKFIKRGNSPGAQFCKSPIKDELFHPTSIIQNDSLYDLSDQRSEICAPHYTHKDTLY